jgi:hypothetical protein
LKHNQQTFMKYILLIFLQCIFFITAKAQITTNISWVEKSSMNAEDVIYYNANTKLTWADFIGPQGPPSIVAAITSSGFGYKAGMHSTNNIGEINVSVYCYFSKPKSWVRKGKTTTYILNHEQHHFDATYICAKKFIEKIRNANLTTSNMNDVLAKLYKDCLAEMSKLQADYDGETKNGQLKEKQEKWNNFFTEKLLFITK